MQLAFERVSPTGEQPFLVKERVERRFPFAWHFHPEYELTLITASQGERFTGDSLEPYAPGDLVLLGANLPHAYASRPRQDGRPEWHRAIYVQFLEDFLGPRFFRSPDMAPVARLLQRAAQGLRIGGQAREAVAKRMTELARGAGLRRTILLLECLEQLAAAPRAELTPLASRGFNPSLRPEEGQRIDAVCRFIHERFAQPIGQPEAAARAHLTVSAFSRFFRRALGKTFPDYVNELRIGHACRLLMETDHGVSRIAFDSGFENLSNFNRRFRELKRLSPRDYRKRYRK